MTDRSLAVTVVGNDRPGIVAAVTRSLYEAGCNLEDVTSTILRGHFSMVLIVRAPDDVSPEDLERRAVEASGELGLVVTVRPVDDLAAPVSPPTHVVSVYGSDKPGIVYRVADALAAGGVNITDLTSRVIGEDQTPIYALMLEVALPGGEALEPLLDSLRSELDVEITSHAVDADVL
jgi:glycine cleavage system transcriptional repressor